MAHIDRPPKTGGTRRYTNEVASGFDLIRETEVDGDLDIVYGEVNGGLDDTNIRPGASIDYSKLDLTGRLQGSDFDPTPTTPLPPGAFPTGGIDTPSLALDATTQFANVAGASITLPHALLDTTELTVSTITTSPASRGGLIWLMGIFSGWFGAPGVEVSLIGRLRASGTQIAISTIAAQFSGSTAVAPFQITCIALPRGLSGGSGPLTLTAQLTGAGGAFAGTAANIYAVQLIALELA